MNRVPGRVLESRIVGIVLAYTLVFFGLLPLALWGFGRRIDALLGLPQVTVLAGGGRLLFALGAVSMLLCMASLSISGHGLPISHLAPSGLVTRGPYAVVRHPIYVAYNLAFLGAGLAGGSLGVAVAGSSLLFVGWLVYALGFEEPRLARRHGTFLAYASRVPVLPGVERLRNAVLFGWCSLRGPLSALANRPVLGRTGPLIWTTFGAFTAAGAALALFVCDLGLRGVLDRGAANAFAFGVTGSILAGSWLAARAYQPGLLASDPEHALRRVGFVSWGGYLGLFAFVSAFARLHDVSFVLLVDRTLVAALLCSTIGRFGCLSYGCCYGRPARAGIVWHAPESKVVREHGPSGAVERFPTQLLSALHTLAIFVLIFPLQAVATPGAPALLVIVCYALGRFCIEFLRDEPRYSSLELTRGQIACLLAFAAAITVLLWLPAAPAGAPPPPLAPPWAGLRSAVLSAAAVFVVCGVHVREVGRW